MTVQDLYATDFEQFLLFGPDSDESLQIGVANSSLPPSTATQIATHAGLAPNPAIGAASTSIASNVIARDDLAASAPLVRRGKRGQLAYDTQQLDARKARRLLSNRASAARSQRRRAERARDAEAALARSSAENMRLQEQLPAALIIEQPGYSAPLAALPATESLPALELSPSPSDSDSSL